MRAKEVKPKMTFGSEVRAVFKSMKLWLLTKLEFKAVRCVVCANSLWHDWPGRERLAERDWQRETGTPSAVSTHPYGSSSSPLNSAPRRQSHSHSNP